MYVVEAPTSSEPRFKLGHVGEILERRTKVVMNGEPIKFEERLDGIFFEGRIVGCAPKVP